MKLPLARVADVLGMGREGAGGDFDRQALALGYSIDSRTIRPGELFFAVKGEKMDGHDFVSQALEKGAVAAVVVREQLSELNLDDYFCDNRWNGRARTPASPQSNLAKLIPVENTLEALQQLACGVRRVWARPLIAVTGSAGKTTTKEAIAHVLSTRFRVHKSEGNFNNQFGLPLMLLKLEPEHDVAAVELGMSHLGEITALSQ